MATAPCTSVSATGPWFCLHVPCPTGTDGPRQGCAWYLRTDDATLFGVGALEKVEQTPLERALVAGDRIGVRMDCDDGSLWFYKNGEAMGLGFPAGTISGPVVGAVELLCPGQALTLVPDSALA